MPSAHGRRPIFVNLLVSLRPGQWTKNLFVFAALVFAQRLTDRNAVIKAGIAFVVFCALSAAVYLINDVLDREHDQRHPLKSHRPIASGALSPTLAVMAAAALALVGMIVAFSLGWRFFEMSAAYVVLLSAYSAFLKHFV